MPKTMKNAPNLRKNEQKSLKLLLLKIEIFKFFKNFSGRFQSIFYNEF